MESSRSWFRIQSLAADMSLRSKLANARREIWCSYHSRSARSEVRGPIVTFSFDDFPRSALTTGGRILEDFGGRATYYVAMSLMGTNNQLGEQFRYDDLYSLVEHGHELASHTFSHVSARKTSFGVFLQDVEKGEKTIQEHIDLVPSGNFAYPYGAVTLAVKQKLGPRMRSCRGTCAGFNSPTVDLNLLRANALYGGIEQAGRARQLILENEKRRGWLIFYSHDVTPDPSPFGCTPTLFEAIVSFVAHRSSRVMTVAEVMTELGHPPAGSAGSNNAVAADGQGCQR